MIMTPEEKDMLIELKNCLSETLAKVREVYGNSAYFQHIQYKAEQDNYENWLFRARQAQEKTELYLKNQKT